MEGGGDLGGHAEGSHLVVVQPKAAAQKAQRVVHQEGQAAHVLVEHQVVQGVEHQIALEQRRPTEVGICRWESKTSSDFNHGGTLRGGNKYS